MYSRQLVISGAGRSDFGLQPLCPPGDELPAGPPPGYMMGGEYTKWPPVRVIMPDGKEVRGERVNEDAFRATTVARSSQLPRIIGHSARSTTRESNSYPHRTIATQRIPSRSVRRGPGLRMTVADDREHRPDGRRFTATARRQSHESNGVDNRMPRA